MNSDNSSMINTALNKTAEEHQSIPVSNRNSVTRPDRVKAMSKLSSKSTHSHIFSNKPVSPASPKEMLPEAY